MNENHRLPGRILSWRSMRNCRVHGWFEIDLVLLLKTVQAITAVVPKLSTVRSVVRDDHIM
jgi:hypothetical protein